jgi:hypothetical protein
MRGEVMSYRVVYGAALVHALGDADETVRSERFSTEHEALNRAREILGQDERHTVAICDASGNVLGGVRLQLKLGFCGD